MLRNRPAALFGATVLAGGISGRFAVTITGLDRAASS